MSDRKTRTPSRLILLTKEELPDNDYTNVTSAAKALSSFANEGDVYYLCKVIKKYEIQSEKKSVVKEV